MNVEARMLNGRNDISIASHPRFSLREEDLSQSQVDHLKYTGCMLDILTGFLFNKMIF